MSCIPTDLQQAEGQSLGLIRTPRRVLKMNTRPGRGRGGGGVDRFRASELGGYMNPPVRLPCEQGRIYSALVDASAGPGFGDACWRGQLLVTNSIGRMWSAGGVLILNCRHIAHQARLMVSDSMRGSSWSSKKPAATSWSVTATTLLHRHSSTVYSTKLSLVQMILIFCDRVTSQCGAFLVPW